MAYPPGVSNAHKYFNYDEPSELQTLLADIIELTLERCVPPVVAEVERLFGDDAASVTSSLPTVDDGCRLAHGSISLDVNFEFTGDETQRDLLQHFYAVCEAFGREGLRSLGAETSPPAEQPAAGLLGKAG